MFLHLLSLVTSCMMNMASLYPEKQINDHVGDDKGLNPLIPIILQPFYEMLSMEYHYPRGNRQAVHAELVTFVLLPCHKCTQLVTFVCK